MGVIPIYLINENEMLDKCGKIGGTPLLNWVRLKHLHEKGDSTHAVWVGEDGMPVYVIAKISAKITQWSVAHLASALPDGEYELHDEHFSAELSRDEHAKLALGWLLEQYRYGEYKVIAKKSAKLCYDAGLSNEIESLRDAIFTVRDLINAPPNHMMPEDLVQAAMKLASSHNNNSHNEKIHKNSSQKSLAHKSSSYKVEVSVTSGEELEREYPAIHTVGKASAAKPCLIDLRWGDESHPLVAIIGKGVCFDSGGLDIKGSANMRLMKKDMGGAACALGLAQLIINRGLKIRLRVLIPAVENAISGNAFRTSDIIKMRSGLTVEVGNTDAEGRLILADAITDACAQHPDLLIDLATLTGAARTALGTDIPAVFSNDDALAAELCQIARQENDFLWQLPLYEGYATQIKSDIADCNSTGTSGYGGAIIAALFLQQFVTLNTPWLHLDMMAWNIKSLAGRPIGGEAMGLRALFALLEKRYK